jgi:hypothetical protein
MPTEQRNISFTHREIVEAIADYCAQIKRYLPNCAIKRVEISDNPELRVCLSSNTEPEPISFCENELAVALLLFCSKRHIPIARRSIKSLKVAEDSLCLQMVLRD